MIIFFQRLCQILSAHAEFFSKLFYRICLHADVRILFAQFCPLFFKIIAWRIMENCARIIDIILAEVLDNAVRDDHVDRLILLTFNDISCNRRVLHNTFIADTISGFINADRACLTESSCLRMLTGTSSRKRLSDNQFHFHVALSGANSPAHIKSITYNARNLTVEHILASCKAGILFYHFSIVSESTGCYDNSTCIDFIFFPIFINSTQSNDLAFVLDQLLDRSI